ncbi:SAP domain protein [Aspergillus stella-maris]|uniref:SAP domain protein n=1 Tax=Aspergillus stella-maris TaxID=1810926 RepID=UPI003CCD1585
MADYSSMKVADLKAELKKRGIPQTGLRVKQQIIDRLIEEDAKGQGEEAGATAAPAEPEAEQAQPAKSEAPAATEQTDNDASMQDPAPEAAPDTQPGLQPSDETPAEDNAAAPSQADGLTAPPSEPAKAEETHKDAQDIQEQGEEAEQDTKAPHEEAATKPVEPAPGGAAKEEPNATQTMVETSQAPSQASGPNTQASTPLPPQELIEDVRKRKRRSQSPAPSLEEIKRRKATALGDAASGTTSETEKKAEADAGTEPVDTAPTKEESQPAPEESPRAELDPKKSTPQKQDVRFKGLFSSAAREQTRASPPPADSEMEDVSVEPALHAATAALYIDGLMRPLQPAALKNHLLSVASAPEKSPNPDLILDFYLDSIKTHCFARFTDVSTASRARNALHGTVWPNEKNRKSLFVDFIPEQKVEDWIQREEDAKGGRGPPPRWEVKYDRKDDEVEAVLEQVDAKSSGSHAVRGAAPQEFSHPPPRGPRADIQPQERRPSAQSSRPSQPGQGFKPLDELFKSTTTKPKLYYLPVSREVADRRLDRFDDLIKKGTFPRRGGDETRKFTFEDVDQFVDLGPEYAGRGRGGGRGRGRGGGSRRDRY